MKRFLNLVFIFLFYIMNVCTVRATPTWTVTDDGTFMIHCNASGDILFLDSGIIRPYKKVIVSGGPLSILDVCTLQSETKKCISIDLTDAEVPFNMIMPYNFTDFKYLEEFKCPKTITSIELGSFYNCPNLKKVVLPKTLNEIGCDSFQRCPKLEIEIPSNVEIGSGSFNASVVKRIDPVPELEEPMCGCFSWFWRWIDEKNKCDEKKNV